MKATREEIKKTIHEIFDKNIGLKEEFIINEIENKIKLWSSMVGSPKRIPFEIKYQHFIKWLKGKKISEIADEANLHPTRISQRIDNVISYIWWFHARYRNGIRIKD